LSKIAEIKPKKPKPVKIKKEKPKMSDRALSPIQRETSSEGSI
jgi:hypothetical protein